MSRILDKLRNTRGTNTPELYRLCKYKHRKKGKEMTHLVAHKLILKLQHQLFHSDYVKIRRLKTVFLRKKFVTMHRNRRNDPVTNLVYNRWKNTTPNATCKKKISKKQSDKTLLMIKLKQQKPNCRNMKESSSFSSALLCSPNVLTLQNNMSADFYGEKLPNHDSKMLPIKLESCSQSLGAITVWMCMNG